MSTKRTTRTAYGPISEALRARIIEGVYPPGCRMPSESRLSVEFHVARTTLRRALAVLEAEGLCTALTGIGRVVVDTSGEGERKSGPQYLRISDDLRILIGAGELCPGDQLPSEAVLTARYRVSRSTVRQALSHLKVAGLIESVQGKGRFVSSRRP